MFAMSKFAIFCLKNKKKVKKYVAKCKFSAFLIGFFFFKKVFHMII